ncbi:MAG: hypothetical protein ACXQS2_05375 [Methermicoccaceae archaeon]
MAENVSLEKVDVESKRDMEVPFMSRVHKATNSHLIHIPMYVVRTFGIEKGDLLVLRIDGKRISGTVTTNKNLFYINKKYWEELDIKPGDKIEIVLEAIYKKVER